MAEKSELIIQNTNFRDYLNNLFLKRKFNHDYNKIYNGNKAIIQNNINRNIIKKRNPAVDLVRILGSWSIIIHHILTHGLVLKKYNNCKILNFINICSFWHVNSFALISGIIGYKTNKYSNLIYLWFCVVFYQIGILFFYILFKKNININTNYFCSFFPVIYSKYWYVTKYFGMYLFLPIINKGIVNITKIEHKILIFSFYGLFIIWNDCNNPEYNVFGLNNGYSILWLIISFITGAYIEKYKIYYIKERKFINCLIFLTIYIFSCCICYKFQYYEIKSLKITLTEKIIKIIKNLFIMRINSIPMILQSISIISLVMNIRYNKYIGRFICFFGPLTFGIYIIHEHEIIREKFIKNLFARDSNQLKKIIIVKLLFIRSIYIFIICSFIDYLRYIFFEYFLKMKKICIFIEKNIFKLCS